MALPLLVVLIVEYLGTRVCFAGDLATPARPAPDATTPNPGTPWFVLTVPGATLPAWSRRIARQEGEHPRLRTFTVHGLVTVPLALVGATVALWASLRVVGA